MQFQCRGTILDIMPPKQLYILVICMLFICNYIINHVFLFFDSCFDGLGEIRVLTFNLVYVLLIVLYNSKL